VTAATQVDDRQVLEADDQRQSDDQERYEQSPSVASDAPVQIETVVITSIYAATAQSTMTAVHRSHRLTVSRSQNDAPVKHILT